MSNQIKANAKNSKTLLLNNDSSFSVKEAYKALRTNIIYSVAQNEHNIITISSPEAGVGRTVSTLNTAISFAQMDKRVLIIDADLRRPQIHTLLDMDNQIGLTNIIVGANSIPEAIKYNKTYNLDVLTSGKKAPNPTELLASSNMKELLQELSAHYDYIFIDTPPVMAVSDAIVVSKLATGMILTVKEGQTGYSTIKEALATLNLVDVKVLGMLLTNDKVETKKKNNYRNAYVGSK